MSSLLRNVFLLAGVGLGLIGCNGPPSTAAPETEVIGRQAQQQVLDFVAIAKKNPAKAPEALTLLNETLEGYVAEYGEEFQPLKEAGLQLQALYQKKAGKAEINAQLQKLTEAANALPGASG